MSLRKLAESRTYFFFFDFIFYRFELGKASNYNLVSFLQYLKTFYESGLEIKSQIKLKNCMLKQNKHKDKLTALKEEQCSFPA